MTKSKVPALVYLDQFVYLGLFENEKKRIVSCTFRCSTNGGTWEPIGNLDGCGPGTEGFSNCFGVKREGDSIILSWESGRWYRAALHSFNNNDDTMQIKYHEATNQEFKTEATSEDTHSMALSTLLTDKLHPDTENKCTTGGGCRRAMHMNNGSQRSLKYKWVPWKE